MKYSEFEKLMEDKGLIVDEVMNTIRVRGGKRFGVVATINTEHPEVYGVYYTEGCPRKLRRFIAQKCQELAFTDLKDREDEKLFYLKQRGARDPNRYVNLNITDDAYTVSDIEEWGSWRTKFTKEEIIKMDTCYTHPAVWEQIPVEEEAE